MKNTTRNILIGAIGIAGLVIVLGKNKGSSHLNLSDRFQDPNLMSPVDRAVTAREQARQAEVGQAVYQNVFPTRTGDVILETINKAGNTTNVDYNQQFKIPPMWLIETEDEWLKRYANRIFSMKRHQMPVNAIKAALPVAPIVIDTPYLPKVGSVQGGGVASFKSVSAWKGH